MYGGSTLVTIKQAMLFSTAMILVVLLPLTVMAGTTGKIAGVVEDEKTGDPIPGATVRIRGLEIATQTDVDGEYFIINLPAGTYTITVSTIGFQGVEKQDVRVLLDLTTPVDFELEQVEIPLKRNVKVYAERAPIQKDLTASKSIITSDRLSHMPNAITVQSIISDMAGTIVGRDNDLHVRGGRSGTISYFYDGFSVQDPFAGDAGIRIMPEALEEINLTLGGFPAEYGEALSGIVNAVTKEGSSELRGRIKFYDGYSHKYDVHSGEYGSLSRLSNNAVSYNLSGPLPNWLGKRTTFFVAGEYRHDGGYLPHNELTQFTQTAKLTFQPAPDWKIYTVGTYFQGERQRYDHRDVNGYSYDFNLDGLGKAEGESYLFGIKSNYNISEKSVFGVSVNHFFTETQMAPEHLSDTYWKNWPGYSEDANGNYNGTIHEDNMQLSEDYYYTGFTTGDDFWPVYHYRCSKYYAGALDYTSQINKYNQIRLGAEFRTYDLTWDDKQFFNDQPYGEQYKQYPLYATVFAQEKLELRDFIINAGLRWDYFYSRVSYWPKVLDKDLYPQVESEPKSHISPRLGISHPIGENTVIRFNYGYFYQVPNYTYMYTNLEADVNTGLPLVGNPDLKAERTISYELGLNHLISNSMRLDVTVYYKDIKNLIATREVFDAEGDPYTYPVTRYTNEDYASAKGFDVTLEKVARGNFSGALVYSYMIAKGNTSSANEAYYRYIVSSDNHIPVKEYPLDYDQRHTVNLTLNYAVPRTWKGKLFGLDIPGAWSLNLTGHYGSGLPYTVTSEKDERLENNVNDGRLPATYSLDMRFNKDVFVKENMYFSFFVEVENLFDRRNIVNVYSNTGRPDYDGRRYDDTSDPDGDGPLTAEDVNRLYRLMAQDPQNYSAPRTVRVGVEFNF